MYFTAANTPAAIEVETRSLLSPEASVRSTTLAPRRVVVLASREHHCLAEVLVRHHFGDLNATITGVISNHPDLGGFVRCLRIPFHHVSHEALARTKHGQKLLALLGPQRPDYLILAKYMRVLTPQFVRRFPCRIINIHHSFLPAFAGAKPYLQAFERGVKVIGATAHFVTAELDQGPIILQEVLPVDHTHTPQDLAQAGRDVEKIALARPLRLVFEHRVFLCQNRTIILD